MCKIFIGGNVPSSKNGKRWTGKMLIHSKTVMKYIQSSKSDYISNKEMFLKMLEGKEPPYKISFQFVRGSKHRFDYINPCQTVQDLMVKYGWIEDDNAEFVIPSFEQYTYNKENPGVIIKVL